MVQMYRSVPCHTLKVSMRGSVSDENYIYLTGWQVIKDTNRVYVWKNISVLYPNFSSQSSRHHGCQFVSHLSANELRCKAKGFVKQMMTVDPVERINIHQVGGGRWVGGGDGLVTTDPLCVNFGKGKLPQTLDLYLGSWFLLGICTGHLVSCISMLDLTWVQLMAVEDSFRAGQWDWRWLKQGTDSMILLLFLVNEICWEFLPLWKILEALDHPWFKIARSATVTRPLLGLGWCWHWDHFGVVMIKIQSDWMSSLMSFFSLYLCCRENAVGHTTYDMFLTILDISINSLWYVCGKNCTPCKMLDNFGINIQV